MAADDNPTLVSLTTEGIQMGGYATAPSILLARAQTQWMLDIKNDIWTLAKKLKSLQKTTIGITTEGVDRYALPTDFSSDLSLSILDGLEVGIAQAGASGSITLAAADNISEAALKQEKGILVYEGTGKNSYSQVTGLSGDIASVSPNFSTAPVADDKYMHVDTVTPAKLAAIWNLDRLVRQTGGTGKPCIFYPIGDEDNGEFVVYPKPYRTSGVPFGMQLRYYCDLMRLDISGTLMATLYRRWRGIFIAGIYYKTLKNEDDERQDKAEKSYRRSLIDLISRETYGTDLSGLQVTVEE